MTPIRWDTVVAAFLIGMAVRWVVFVFGWRNR
jgi:uncharacterized membrane protein YczE